MVKHSAKKKVSSNLYDRLSRTDTYASRRLKEKVQRTGDIGRPLFKLELEKEALCTYKYGGVHHNIKQSSSGTTVSTSSIGNNNTNRSSKNRRKGGQSIFDRLASTGTKSSLRKHKQSATFVNDDDTIAESMKKFHCRDFQSRNGTIDGRAACGRNNNIEISFFPNQNEAEI